MPSDRFRRPSWARAVKLPQLPGCASRCLEEWEKRRSAAPHLRNGREARRARAVLTLLLLLRYRRPSSGSGYPSPRCGGQSAAAVPSPKMAAGPGAVSFSLSPRGENGGGAQRDPPPRHHGDPGPSGPSAPPSSPQPPSPRPQPPAESP